MPDYKENQIRFTGPNTPDASISRIGDKWYNTNKGVLCSFYNGEWDCIAVKGQLGFIPGGHGGVTSSPFSSVEKLVFPFSGASTIGFNLNTGATEYVQACNSTMYGYILGGSLANGSDYISTIQKISFSDTTNQVVIGSLSAIRGFGGGFNSSSHAYVAGGAGLVSAYTTIDRVTFSADTTASLVGNLANTGRWQNSSCNSSIHGFIVAGYNTVFLSYISRLTFPNNSGNLTDNGNLSTTRQGGACFNDSVYGYMLGGSGSTTYLSSVENIIFPFVSGTTSVSGYLSSSRYGMSAVNSTLYGYSCGNGNSGSANSTIDMISFSFTSGNTSMVGSLSTSRCQTYGFDSTDFTATGMFV